VNKNFKLSKNHKLIEIESIEPANFIAPHWKFHLWFYSLNDTDFLGKLKQILLEEEKNIIKTYPAFNDGGTGLGFETVTSRYNTFNLFRISRSEIKNLKNYIGLEFKKYLESIQFEGNLDFSPMINCWFNVMDPGQSINLHSHNLSNTSFISGHITISCEDSYTYYITPYTKDRLEFVNNPGEGIFFPSYIEHGTSAHKGLEKRITLAFDLYYNVEQANSNIRNNLVELYD